MCDTVVVTPEVSADHVMYFGKNSDREPNEAHLLILCPAADHPANQQVQLTYIQIPQAEHVNAVLLAKPFWIWGAEMGVNEYGVAIGNEAVFTKLPVAKAEGMIGMDLLRLGLERGATARESLEVMTGLLAVYGQGGNCGFQHPMYYHNSFLIADPQEAWVFETAGMHWAAKKIQGVYTISNGLTIRNDWDMASSELVSYAVERGWCKSKDDFDFARCYSDLIYTRFSNCRERCDRSSGLLAAKQGRIATQDVMDVLRDHGSKDEQPVRVDRGITGSSVCMHAGYGPVRASQTVGSMVSRLEVQNPTHFFTATAAPCTSLFKPVWMDAGLPETGPQPVGSFDPKSLFWRHELLHRETLLDYPARIRMYQQELDCLEKEFVSKAMAAANDRAEVRHRLSIACFEEADRAEAVWLERLRQNPPSSKNHFLYRTAWDGLNRSGKLPGSKNI